MKTIQIPDELWQDFLIFLDVAQSRFTEEEIANFSKNEQSTLELIDYILKKHTNGPSKRFKRKIDKTKASEQLTNIISGRG